MYTIGQLAKKFKLARSTLLYYDSIGLLAFSGRTASNYRTYSEADCQRLEQICTYREAGLSLDKIKELLTGTQSVTVSLLENQIHELNMEINKLRDKQKLIVRLLLNFQVQQRGGSVDKNAWLELFSAAGFSGHDRWKWHRDFEMTNPDKHELFMESLGLLPDEIASIRDWARSDYERAGAHLDVTS